mmetsp:Transcript_8414/g.26949  ORF Transcript_8414/g.26949 Transcript_8414/m.26949 type:complete len:293 (+) Transcript_8414:2872-3750(+)
MFSLPAVSTMTTSISPLFFASATPFAAIDGGDAFAPSSYTGTFKSLPNFFSWSIAAGLYTSVATNKHVLFCFFKLSANFPHAVVFPTPCKPAIKITVGPFPSSRKLIPSAPTPPIKVHNSSATNFTNSWLGSTPFVTFTPGALSSTFLINLLTTGKLTSASNKALLTSFKGALIFSGDKSATPFIFAHASSNVADKLLNASALMTIEEARSFFFFLNPSALFLLPLFVIIVVVSLLHLLPSLLLKLLVVVVVVAVAVVKAPPKLVVVVIFALFFFFFFLFSVYSVVVYSLSV